jgi:hypothetical protein
VTKYTIKFEVLQDFLYGNIQFILEAPTQSRPTAGMASQLIIATHDPGYPIVIIFRPTPNTGSANQAFKSKSIKCVALDFSHLQLENPPDEILSSETEGDPDARPKLCLEWELVQ